MRFWLGFAAGLGAAWAALAIWQQVPPLAAIVWEDDDTVPEGKIRSAAGNLVPDLDRLARNGERDDVHLRQKFPPPPVRDPKVHVTPGVRP